MKAQTTKEVVGYDNNDNQQQLAVVVEDNKQTTSAASESHGIRSLLELNWATYGTCMAFTISLETAASMAFDVLLAATPATTVVRKWPSKSVTQLLCDCAQKLTTLDNSALSLRSTTHLQSQCRMMNALLTGIGCSSGPYCTVQFSSLIPTTLFSARILSLPLENRLLLPPPSTASSPLPTSYLPLEGPTYHALWTAVRTVYNLHTIATCGPQVCPTCTQLDYVIPEWKVITVLNIAAAGSPSGNVRPLLVLARRASSVLLVLRGARHIVDWMHVLKYNFTTSTSHTTVTTTATGGGNVTTVKQTVVLQWPYVGVSEGIARMATALIKPIFDYIANNQQQQEITDIIITGHSLGAGIGSLLSYQIALFVKCINTFNTTLDLCYPPTTTTTLFNTTTTTIIKKSISYLYYDNNNNTTATLATTAPPTTTTPAVVVSAVLFASPKVSNSEFSLKLSQLVNIRSVVYVLDAVSSLPCKTMFACGADMAIVPTTAATEVKGNKTFPNRYIVDVTKQLLYHKKNKVNQLFIYDNLPGTVKIKTADLPSTSLWRTNPFPEFAVGPNHWCAFSCFLATRFAPFDTKTECMVDQSTRTGILADHICSA
eukprot:GHVS01050597.1.p1 GENE.GHVS01050597.1~~GHVS01050597.1.p1  ORF type:complete len:661 (+),score=134.71 GHVS01050597.1:184-1983(+)